MSNRIASTPSEWGPMIWNIIHTASLRIGKTPISDKNETRLFIALTKILPYSLPCKICQTHAGEYLRSAESKKRINKWITLTGDELKAEIVHFFWDFHNNANKTKESPTGFYELESLLTKYSADEQRKQAREDLPILLRTLSTAVTQHIIYSDNAYKFRTVLQQLVRLATTGWL
jgi:hypothetical protein